ncbi:helix-turn-helix domain-containing protein [Guptibacillus hwajinpoensis]|uniref:helix-turn-helix domain-containing protein n=1 Tax=Guptibacillus hwajinpoensis TaxID=208199 RepID=UPI001CFE6D87|nr:helix-turn-helix domain-containing protein [Pseudalkalibacillus hwajinpoensis]
MKKFDTIIRKEIGDGFMQYFDVVLLYIFDRFKGERSLSAVYHLLTGKKSSQTIQDGKLFNIGQFFGVLKKLNRAKLEQHVSSLQEAGLIKPNQHEGYEITSSGREALTSFLASNPLPEYLAGWQYHKVSDLYWQRLSLFVQSLSYSIRGNMSFYPISKDETIQNWVKKHFPMTKEKRVTVAENLFQEMQTILNKLPDRDASMFVMRLSGIGRTGLTISQLADMQKISYEETSIRLQSVIHAILKWVQNHSGQSPILASMIEGEGEELPLTLSTKQTYKLLESGMTIEQIVHLRRLKRSTIEDHLVEIAINVPEFSIDAFVDPKAQADIRLASKEIKSQRLKLIKNYVKDQYTYFEIRLTLCKEGI